MVSEHLKGEAESCCPICHTPIAMLSGVAVRYCPFCGNSLMWQPAATLPSIESGISNPSQIPSAIGPYQIFKSIGKGGMGEVFLAYDPLFGRRIALKRIRPDLIGNKAIFHRFLKEARITSQLTHPSIIAIYAIRDEGEMAYYTMPYVEGETLKQLLTRTKQQQRRCEELDHVGGSIPALIRIFLSICQAVAYAHSKQVLHRDLKPENIIIGRFGEVLILDWGLAQLLTRQEGELPEIAEGEALPFTTHLGKVVGTFTYMAPERVLGHPSTIQSDIFSLGVILYQILTLRMPFHRKTLKQFRKKACKEQPLDPTQAAPHRDIPSMLARITMQCLANLPEQRYSSLNELIHDLENYLEGRSEWLHIARLDIDDKSHWEFQEHVFLGQHVAISSHAEVPDWVQLMISKASFSGNTKLEAKVKLGESSHGIGFLLSIPEASQRSHLNDGYCLWLSSDLFRSSKLLRSTVEVMHIPEVFLTRHLWHDICIEKVESNIHFFLDGQLQFSYISHMPLSGTHVGLLSRDANFALGDCMVFVGNLNATVSCLAIPDAFLAHKEYGLALSEYRRIAYSFIGHSEGREALFRAGITLLEKARLQSTIVEKQKLLDESLEEFSTLHQTAGAPLEYIGKALVYQEMQEYEEEGKCFELGLRRYPYHPLLRMLQEQVIYRMYEASRSHRKATYNFILLAVRHIPSIATTAHANKLFSHLCRHWEPLPFLELHEQPLAFGTHAYAYSSFATALAFWLAKAHVLEELLDEQLAHRNQCEGRKAAVADIFFAALELGLTSLVTAKLEQARQRSNCPRLADINICLQATTGAIISALDAICYEKEGDSLAFFRWRSIAYLIEKALDRGEESAVHQLAERVSSSSLSERCQHLVTCWRLWAYMQQQQWDHVSLIFQQYTFEQLNQEHSPLHFLYGCWLEVSENHDVAMAHFAGVLEAPYPRSWMLFSHYIMGKLDARRGWQNKAFFWEKRQLCRQLALFWHCRGDERQAQRWKEQAQTDPSQQLPLI